MKKSITFLTLLSFVSSLFLACSKQMDDDDAKINALIQQMTLDEKLDFIGGYNDFNIRAVHRLGIPEIRFADGPIGVRNYGASTAYPAGINLAASFNKHTANNFGKAIAIEAKAKNVHVMLGPAMNIYRAPFCGRNFEYFGEDPYLAGQMGAAYTKGMQEQGVMATAKHYAANNQDFSRHLTSSDMDERTLHEIYLPAFKTTVQEGNVASIMTSYNLVNGIHASQHDYLINQVLKNDWGFEGFVMSDWGSTYDGLGCAIGGLDLEMPAGKFMNPDTLRLAIESGTFKVSTLDDKIRRILRMYEKFDLFQHPDISKGFTPDTQWVRSFAVDAAREGIVLLKNDNNYLPLKKESVKHIAIIGPNGNMVVGGGGSSTVEPLHPLNLADAIKEQVGPDVEVVFAKGVVTRERLPKKFFENFTCYSKTGDSKTIGVQAEFFANRELKGTANFTKTFPVFNLEEKEMRFEGFPEKEFSARFTCYYQPEKTDSFAIYVSGDDGYRLYVDNQIVIDLWQEQGEVTKNYLTKFIAGKEYKLTVEYFQAGGSAAIRMNVDTKKTSSISPEQIRNEALTLAKKSDQVILAVGFNQETESEGFDRTFDLPFNQNQLITDVLAVNPNCVVVLNAGGNVNMEPWIHQVKGLLHAWFPGQEGNRAVAEILFGKTNPSGKLPASFEVKFEDNPTFNSYWDTDKDLKVFYSEGIFLGYRYYDKSETKPRFPFGFGLSYTTFKFSKLTLAKNEFETTENVTFTVDIQNTGKVAGKEVVQVYVSDLVTALPRPLKELKAFEKVALEPGETKTVTFTLTKDAFSYYNPSQKGWVLEPGDFEIMVGSSSVDISQKAVLTFK